MLRWQFMLRWAAPAALLAVFFFQSFLSSRLKSATFDEPAHIAAGLSYLSTGVFHANPQHPPLMKELSGIALLLGGIRWPNTATTRDIVTNPPGVLTGRDWEAGKEIFALYGIDRTLAIARLPMILTAVFLGLIVYLWGRQMMGEAAALGALFVYALDPNIVAHSFLVTTDVGLAAFGTAFLFALWRYMQAPSLKRQIWCGVALGCALGAKYSAVLLLPIAAALLCWPAFRGRRSGVAAVAPNQPCPCGSGKKYKACHALEPQTAFDRASLIGAARAFGVMCLTALAMVELFYGFRATPLQYIAGLGRVNADHDPNYLTFLGGETQHRFLHYFGAAYLLKTPLASIALVALGSFAVSRGKSLSGLARLFLFVPPLVLFAAYSLKAANLGIRYIIPVLPFLHLLGGAGLARLIAGRSSAAKAVAAALCLWMVVAAAGIYPDDLSYFNESACALSNPSLIGIDGGSRCGPAWLDDSNVDWGQGLKQLRTWLDANANGRPVHILFHGSIPPETYGIANTPPPPAPTGAPALYVMSGHYVARLSMTDDRVRRTPPIAIVGHAFWVYQF